MSAFNKVLAIGDAKDEPHYCLLQMWDDQAGTLIKLRVARHSIEKICEVMLERSKRPNEQFVTLLAWED